MLIAESAPLEKDLHRHRLAGQPRLDRRCGDAALRRRIGSAGNDAFNDVFTADEVAPTIGDGLLRAA
jgi:hypothetical protein